MIQSTRIEACCARQAQRAQLVAARFCGVTPDRLVEPSRGDAETALARQLAMYLASRVYRLSHARAAAMFGRDRDAASYACRRIESLREDARFNWQLFEVETLLRAAELMAQETRDAP